MTANRWLASATGLFVTLFLFLSVAAVSAENLSTAITREQAMASAATRHPRIDVFARKIDAAAARVGQVRSGFLPRVSFIERYSRTNNPMWAFGTTLNQETITSADFDPNRLNDPDDIDNFTSLVDVKWPLFDSGQTWHGWHQAKKGVSAAEIELGRIRQEVIANAAAAYDGVLLAIAQLRVIEQAISLSKAHLNLVEERYRSGFVVKSDLLRSRVRLADLEQKRFAAQSGVAVAKAGLGAALGEAPARKFEPTDELVKFPCRQASIEQWIEWALERRPALRLMTIREEIAQNEITKQKSSHLPALSLFGNYEVNSERFDDTGENFTVGAMMEVSLFSGGQTLAKTREAQAILEEIQAQRRDLIAGIEVEVRKAFHETSSAEQRIGVAEASVEQARENRRIVADRYGNGLLTIVELLDAETAIEDARNNLYKALHDYRVSHVHLELAAGLLEIAME